MEVAHGGGRRLHEERRLRIAFCFDWIAEGLRLDRANEPDLVKIQILPASALPSSWARGSSFAVLGHFSDGSRPRRDADHLFFSSSNESVATVVRRRAGRKGGRGETAILARSRQDGDRLHHVSSKTSPASPGTTLRKTTSSTRSCLPSSNSFRSCLRTCVPTRNSCAAPTLDADGPPAPIRKSRSPFLSRTMPTSGPSWSTSWSTAPTSPSSGP